VGIDAKRPMLTNNDNNGQDNSSNKTTNNQQTQGDSRNGAVAGHCKDLWWQHCIPPLSDSGVEMTMMIFHGLTSCEMVTMAQAGRRQKAGDEE